jgi:hypothetical protein
VWLGQCLGPVFPLPVRAGQSVGVLGHVFPPRGDREKFHEAIGCLRVAKQSPLQGSAAKTGAAHTGHDLEELLLTLRCHRLSATN